MIHAFGLLLSALLNDKLVETKLLRSAFEHTFLDTALCNEAEHIHLLRLSDSVRAVHGLQVGLGIPGPAVSTLMFVDRRLDLTNHYHRERQCQRLSSLCRDLQHG